MDDFKNSTLFPPMKGLETIGVFLNPQPYPGDVIQWQTVAETLIYRIKNIQRRKGAEIERYASGQHPVIKAVDIESKDPIQFLQVLDKQENLIFQKRMIGIFIRIV